MQKKSAAVGRKVAHLDKEEIDRGAGGETHQHAGEAVPVLTTQQGVPVPSCVVGPGKQR